MNAPRLILTVDTELPAGGVGDVRKHMIEPARRLLDVCEANGARLTIMVEMGELWAFDRSPSYALGYSPADEIREQLVDAVRRGHDVQLHLHPQWLDAYWDGRRWALDYAHYQLCDLPVRDAIAVLRRGREELNRLLKPHAADYECVAFRAGHWNTSPSVEYLAALEAAGLCADTSVFKGGRVRRRSVDFDYRAAHHAFRAWPACRDDINRADPDGSIIEIPIATREVSLAAMLSLKRLRLACRYLREDRAIESQATCARAAAVPKPEFMHRLRRLFGRHPMKLDFCKLSAGQMLRMVEGFVAQCEIEAPTEPVPLVAIGHSKQLGAERDLDAFLRQARQRLGPRIAFSTLRHFVYAFEEEVRECPLAS